MEYRPARRAILQRVPPRDHRRLTVDVLNEEKADVDHTARIGGEDRTHSVGVESRRYQLECALPPAVTRRTDAAFSRRRAGKIGRPCIRGCFDPELVLN